MKTTWAILVSLGVAASVAAYYAKHRTAEPATNFRTVAIQRGELLSTIRLRGPWSRKNWLTSVRR